MADHREQGLVPRRAVDDPIGVEDFVPAVLGVHLGEHHQLHIRGIAPQVYKTLHQVIDLVPGQGQTKLAVRNDQGRAPSTQHIDGPMWTGVGPLEQPDVLRGILYGKKGDLGHGVVEGGRGSYEQVLIELGGLAPERVGDAPLQASDLVHAAVVGDVRGLGRPGRDGPQPRHHQHQCPFPLRSGQLWALGQQPFQQRLFLCGQDLFEIREVQVFGIDLQDLPGGVPQALFELAQTEFGVGGGAAQNEHDYIQVGGGCILHYLVRLAPVPRSCWRVLQK